MRGSQLLIRTGRIVATPISSKYHSLLTEILHYTHSHAIMKKKLPRIYNDSFSQEKLGQIVAKNLQFMPRQCIIHKL